MSGKISVGSASAESLFFHYLAMEITFVASNPRQKARPEMERLMSRGDDQLIVATAFCTAAGVALLRAQAVRLRRPGSFVVVSYEKPTDYPELAHLHSMIPGNLFVHWGSESPYEKKSGAALMHSKIIYARSGRDCWLWTGSHNFTANATQGGNCEAAVIVRGTVDDQPFADALAHLDACRSEASPYDPDVTAPNGARRDDILVIHSESALDGNLRLPCRLQLCLETSHFDELLTPALSVRLFLYPRGALRNGWQMAIPDAAFSGAVTGVNLTGMNPNVGSGGTTAEWRSARLSIENTDSEVLVLGPARAVNRAVATQAAISIDGESDPNEILFSRKPEVVQSPVLGSTRTEPVDPDMRSFFRSNDLVPAGLLHTPIVGRKQVIRVGEGDLRARDVARVSARLAGREDISFERQAIPERSGRHPFIYLAKYRLPE